MIDSPAGSNQSMNDQPRPKQSVTVISTGGTIEKTYDELDGSLANRGPVMKQRIEDRLRLPHTQIEVWPVLSMDSLFMEDEHRKVIHQAILKALQSRDPVIIMHGTDTMTRTAEYCLEQSPQPCAPVVFTGAMVPMGFEHSDALQNVTEALIAVQLLPPAYYIAFHNRIFRVPHAQKDLRLKTFVDRS